MRVLKKGQPSWDVPVCLLISQIQTFYMSMSGFKFPVQTQQCPTISVESLKSQNMAKALNHSITHSMLEADINKTNKLSLMQPKRLG